MPQFSKKSLERLATCDPRLQMICHEAIKTIDFTVICGHRGEAEQNKAFKEGKSKLRWPTSKHNKNPSLAVDLAPVKYVSKKASIDWADISKFRLLSDLMKEIAKEKHISLTWGGDFKYFYDGPHYELANTQDNDNMT